MVACCTGSVQCRGGMGGGGDKQCSSGLAPAQSASPPSAPERRAVRSPVCSLPQARAAGPAEPADLSTLLSEMGSSTLPRSATPARPRLQAAAEGSVVYQAGWQ